MEDIYYFSQGRLIHNVPYKKFEKTKDTKEIKEIMSIKKTNGHLQLVMHNTNGYKKH